LCFVCIPYYLRRLLRLYAGPAYPNHLINPVMQEASQIAEVIDYDIKLKRGKEVYRHAWVKYGCLRTQMTNAMACK
jgi:hypothetical protein